MRYILGAVLGLVVSATFGCGGSSDDSQTAANTNTSGQSAGTAAAGMAPMGDPAGGAAPAAPAADGAAAMPSGGPGLPGGGAPATTYPGDPSGGSNGAGPDGTVPGATVPGATVPGATVPGGAVPGGAYPGGIPGGAPGSSIPGGAYPGGIPGGAPGSSIPGGAIPGGIPGSSIPGGAIPNGAVPGSSVPGSSVPGSTVPGSPFAGSYPGAVPGATGSLPGASVPGGIPGTPGLDTTSSGIPGFPGSPGSEGGVAAPTTFDGFAKQSFMQGKERAAMQYLQAWAITSDEGAADVLSGFQWVPALGRPALAVRWGVGVQLTAPRGFNGDPKAIGSQQQLGGARARKDGAGEGNPTAGSFAPGGEGGIGGGGGGNDAITKYAGDFGSMVLEQFQSRVSSGKFGKALKDAPAGGSAQDSSGLAGGLPGGVGGIPGGFPSGGLASGGPPGSMPGGRMGMRGPGGGAAAAGGELTQITPGLTMLGQGAEKELKDRALKDRIDVLAIFRVKVTVNPAGLVVNDVEIILQDPLKGKELFNSNTLNNIKIQKAREQSKEDGVEKEVNRLFEFVDSKLAMTDLPAALTPELVKSSRVEKQLLAGSIDDPLAVLAEIRFYHRNKFLTDADASAAMAKVAGDTNAKTLLDGKEEERKKVVEKWLPRT